MASEKEIILSLEKMNRIEWLNPLGQIMQVEAGVITQYVHDYTAPYGLTWPIDFASKGSSQVGGNIATNAGGMGVLRYGSTRHWVRGLEVVTMRGEVLDLTQALDEFK